MPASPTPDRPGGPPAIAGPGPLTRFAQTGPGLALLYTLAWLALVSVAHLPWFLPAGFRLGMLWLTPTRRWRWLALGEWAAMAVIATRNGLSLFGDVSLVMSLSPWLIYATVVLLARRASERASIDAPRGMLALLSAGLFSAALVSPILQHYIPDASGRLVGMAGIFSFMYGDFIGQLVLAPLMLLLSRPASRHRLDAALWADVTLQLLFSLSVFWLIRARLDLAPFVVLLAFAPIFFVAFRRGWEGAAVSVAVVGLLVEAIIQFEMVAVDTRVLQLALAVVGGGGLVLGAASSELRRSHERLALRHQELAQANSSLTEAADDLRNISQRLVRLEEQGQRELATELDYELGRSIDGLSTRISLAFRDVRDEQMLRLLESIREQVREMQDSLRRALRQLRPQVLDTHGLREAVAFGPLRDTLEDAGIGYEAVFIGTVESLDDDAQTTVYRICQAAVREASRNQSIRRVEVKIQVGAAERGHHDVQMQIDIEALSLLDFPSEPLPLAAITDRVLAQQGRYWVEPLAPGVRHCVRFSEDATALS
jgi:two-component system sensor histidine kinase UhpB